MTGGDPRRSEAGGLEPARSSCWPRRRLPQLPWLRGTGLLTAATPGRIPERIPERNAERAPELVAEQGPGCIAEHPPD